MGGRSENSNPHHTGSGAPDHGMVGCLYKHRWGVSPPMGSINWLYSIFKERHFPLSIFDYFRSVGDRWGPRSLTSEYYKRWNPVLLAHEWCRVHVLTFRPHKYHYFQCWSGFSGSTIIYIKKGGSWVNEFICFFIIWTAGFIVVVCNHISCWQAHLTTADPELIYFLDSCGGINPTGCSSSRGPPEECLINFLEREYVW